MPDNNDIFLFAEDDAVSNLSVSLMQHQCLLFRTRATFGSDLSRTKINHELKCGQGRMVKTSERHRWDHD